MKETESDKSLKISASPKKPVYILVGWRFLYVSLRDDPSAGGLQNAMHQEKVVRRKEQRSSPGFPSNL